MADLLVRGGSVVDGTGSAASIGDVRIRDGLIAEVGPSLHRDGELELDAGGAIVTPGFIDAHTHLDPWLWWDPSLDPVPQHGITTVLTGNCSLSLAPVGAARSALTDMFSYIEDVPANVFDEAVPWTWESWDEYMRDASAVRSTVRIAPLVGLSALRLAVLGDASFDRPSTDTERIAIAALVQECMRAGASGLSLSFLDTDRLGRPVPSRLADDGELHAVMEVVADAAGIVEFVAGSPAGQLADVDRMGRICRATGAVSTWVQLITLGGAPEYHREFLEQANRLQNDGANVIPQVSPRELLFQLNLAGTIQFMGLELWNAFVNAPIEEKHRLAVDPSWRARARQEWDSGPGTMFPRDDLARVAIVPTALDREPGALPGTLAELQAQRGGHSADIFLDWAAEHDMNPGLMVTVANENPDMVAEVLASPATLVAASDVGAHIQMMAAHGDPTLLLTRHVLERGDLTLEQAVARLTAEPARVLGMHDRGIIKVGKRADLAIVDLSELEYLPAHLVHDLPGGASRFTRPAKGIRATVVDGEPTQIDGALTGKRPAGMTVAASAG
jgi:N-acyl-D-amino-acid deacylase